MSEIEKKPKGFLERVGDIYANLMKVNAGTVSDTVAGVDNIGGSGFFSPGQPLRPMGPKDEQGRALDYNSGYNINLLPRGYEQISFPELRMLAEYHDVTRLLIETRKDQIEALDWIVKPRFKDGATDALKRAGATEEFLHYPDGETNFHTWIRELVEDILVIDAPTIYVDRDDPLSYRFKIVDGTTIKLIIDEEGRRPLPPSPAYQQIIKGMPAWNYSTDSMIYMPRNPRPGKVYGMSPVQQIIITVNIALRRQSSQLQFFTEGNIPDAFIGTPKEWTPEQIVAYQKAWDSIMEGQTAQRRHAKFVPGGVEIVQTKDVVLKNDFDEWLTKICCFAFSIPPTAFIQQTNRSVAENVKQAAEEEGLAPLTRHVKRIMDCIIQRHLGQYDLEFGWSDKEETDPQALAVINDTKIRNGTKTINEARKDDGLDPVEGGDVPVIMTASGPIPVASLTKLPVDPMQGFLAPQNGPEGEAGGEGDGGKPPFGGKDGKKPPASGKETSNEDEQTAAKDDGQKDTSAQKKEVPAKAARPFVVKGGLGKKTLYVYRPLLNAGEVIEWAKEQGFKTCLPPADMHVTQAYSKARVNWNLLQPKTNKITVGRSRRSLDLLGPNAEAVVLRFEDFQLRNRFQQFADMGCSWDWDTYKPHVTLTYDRGLVNVKQLQPFEGDLIFGPEIFEEVEEDWADSITEKSIKGYESDDGGKIEKRRIPSPQWVDPLYRPQGAKTERALYRILSDLLATLGKDVAAQMQAMVDKKNKVQKADPPDDTYSLLRDAFLDTIDSVDLSDLDNVVISSLTIDELTNLIEDTGKQTFIRMGVPARSDLVDQLNVNARDFASDQAAELVGKKFVDGKWVDNPNPKWSITQSTRDMLRATVTEAFDAGVSLPDLTDAIEQSAAFSPERARMIARTESLRAANKGTLAAIKTAEDGGLSVQKVWLAAPDSCDICLDNQDQGPIDTDEDFDSGDDAPPAHPNCRCSLSVEAQNPDD